MAIIDDKDYGEVFSWGKPAWGVEQYLGLQREQETREPSEKTEMSFRIEGQEWDWGNIRRKLH